MDNNFRALGCVMDFSSSVLGNLVNFQNRAVHRTDTTLRLDSHGSNGLIFKGLRRKWDAITGEDDPKDVSSLILGLGHPPSLDNSKTSSATVCSLSSAKEADEESSSDLGLNFHLHSWNKSRHSPKRLAMAAPKALEMEPSCDLQLSLSMGQSQSVITSTSPVSSQRQDGVEASATTGATSLVDDGSTSSCWKPEDSFLPFNFISVNETAFMHSIPKKAESQLLSTSELMPKRPATCSSGFTQQHTTNTRVCKFQGCGKGARGASGLCIAHGGGRRCQREGCNKGAEGRTVYCKAHGGGRRCQFLGCTKSAEGRTEYCIAHGGGRRCSHEGCTKAARGRSGLCIRHGGGKRCEKENCTKSAEGHSGLCISHGGGRRCQFPACSKGAQGSTVFCKAHGGGKRCTALGCTKGAEGSTAFCKGHGGGKRCSFQGGGVCPKSVHGGTHFCVAHGGGKRCAVPECTRSARGRTDFCVRHGGGKRCKFVDCGKSAQGRTDYCKAHGGGKRCLWGQAGSNIGVDDPPCDRFARGKTGLCFAHTAQVPDPRVHGGGKLGLAASQALPHGSNEKLKNVTPEGAFYKARMDDKKVVSWNVFCPQVVRPESNLVTLPEGRVHGGSLIAMLASGTGIDSQTGRGAPGNASGQGAEYMLPRKWM